MDKCILVQYLNSINSVISETFKSTQRIKVSEIKNIFICLLKHVFLVNMF